MRKIIDRMGGRKYPHTYTFKLEWVMALLQGKRIELNDGLNGERFVFYPPQGGIFMTHDEYHALRLKLLSGMVINPEETISEIRDELMDTGVTAQLSRMTNEELGKVVEDAKSLRNK